MLDVEVAALWRTCRELRAGMAAGDAEAVREWVDELEVIATCTECPAIRSRAATAIASSLLHVPAQA